MASKTIFEQTLHNFCYLVTKKVAVDRWFWFFDFYIIPKYHIFNPPQRRRRWGGRGGMCPTSFGISVNPIRTKGDRLCPPYYYCPPHLFGQCGVSAPYFRMCTLKFGLNSIRTCSVVSIQKICFKKNYVSRSLKLRAILLPYKKCVTEKRAYLNKLKLPLFVLVFWSIPFNKLPFFHR